jgi:hypothetical protein
MSQTGQSLIRCRPVLRYEQQSSSNWQRQRADGISSAPATYFCFAHEACKINPSLTTTAAV